MQNPHMADIPMNREVTYFGRTNFRGENKIFGIKRKDRRQHMYILGKSGTGKSVLITNMIIQNIWNGEGLCLVDPHGELVETVIKMIPEHRIKDVVYFNPADTDYCIGFNPLEIGDPKYKHLVASGLMGIFTKIWANVWSSRMEYIMNNAILALLDTPGTTLLGITRMLVDKDYRQVIVNNLKDPIVKAFWVHEYEQWKEQFRNEAIAPIQNKVGQFLSSSVIRNIVGQSESTIDVFNIMNEGKIFLVNVSKGRIGEDNAALLGAMLITKIQLAAMERVRIPEEERRDFYLYVDEFQNFATDSFANILSEARKYRLCLTLAHQYTAQIESGNANDLKDAVFGNVGTMIIFRVGSEDAESLEKEFSPEFIPEDFVGLPNYQIYLKLMIDGLTSRPFSANTLPPIKISLEHDTTNDVIDSSRKLYSKTKTEVESNMNTWSSDSVNSKQPKILIKDKDGNSVETRLYPATCDNCKKEISVPFEPKQGKPIYCKECLQKIKIGELKPAKGFYDKTIVDGPKPVEILANLGIEFALENKNKPVVKNTQNTKPIHNQNKQQVSPPKTNNEDGFTSLKDLLGKIHPTPNIPKDQTSVTKTTQIPKQNQNTVTLNPLTKSVLQKNQTSVNKATPILTKSASNESKNLLKNILENNTKIAQEQTPQKENTIESKKDTLEIENDIPVPKPPAHYQKRTPEKEVPEDILVKLFTKDNDVNT